MYHNRTFHPPPSTGYKYRVSEIIKCCMKIIFSYTKRERAALSRYKILFNFVIVLGNASFAFFQGSSLNR